MDILFKMSKSNFIVYVDVCRLDPHSIQDVVRFNSLEWPEYTVTQKYLSPSVFLFLLVWEPGSYLHLFKVWWIINHKVLEKQPCCNCKIRPLRGAKQNLVSINLITCNNCIIWILTVTCEKIPTFISRAYALKLVSERQYYGIINKDKNKI